jgi:hypothetical protein
MLNYVTVEHVHTDVVGELKLELKVFPGIKVPGLLHRFIWITRPPISTDALLSDVVNVHGVRLSVGFVKTHFSVVPRTGRASDSIGIEP